MNQSKSLPLISVIVPSFNQGQFLDQALNSIFRQSYPKLEVIVMDGGSSDNSVDIIKKHESKLSYWQSQPDGGQSAAINAGMRLAKGELVAWLNSDDYYLKKAFSRLLKVYQGNPKASFYAGNGFRVTESGLIKEPFYKTRSVSFDRNSLIHSVDYILQPCTFMNRQCVEAVDYLNETLKYGMDWDLFIRLSEISDPVLFHECIAATREYENTKTASGYFERIEELRLIAKKHSGYDLTPGVMCYVISDLLKLSEKNQALYPAKYRLGLYNLWELNKDVLIENKMDISGFFIKKKKPRALFVFIAKVYHSIGRVIHQMSRRLFQCTRGYYRKLRDFAYKICIALPLIRETIKLARTIYYRLRFGLYAK